MDAYCSNCFQWESFLLKEKNTFSSDRYKCCSCGAPSVECTVPGCDAMALAPPKSTFADFFCAEHNGSIRNFETVNSKLSCLTDFNVFMKKRSVNASALTKGAGVAVGTATIIAATGGLAAPAIAAKLGTLGLLGAAGTGTAISTLTGAALTSASLAALGGSVVGGIAVVSAAGAAFGAYQGGAISQGYFGEVDPFDIRMISEGSSKKPAVIVVNGFLSDIAKNRREWKALAKKTYPGHSIYELEWESKRLQECYSLFTEAGSMANLVQKYGKKTTNGLSAALAMVGIAKNPFHTAVVKSEMTGQILAELIARTPLSRKYILMGHSLGARVIFYTLLALHEGKNHRKSLERIVAAHFFGGAVGVDPAKEWRKAAKTTNFQIFNYHSQNDKVLQFLYKIALAASAPIGRNAISGVKGITNMDVTEWVDGHTGYVENAGEFMNEVWTSRKPKSNDRKAKKVS